MNVRKSQITLRKYNESFFEKICSVIDTKKMR